MQFLSRVPTALAIVATSTLAGVGAYVATRPAPIPVTTPEIAMDVREPAQPSIDDLAVVHETAPVTRPQQAPPDDHRIELAFTLTIDKFLRPATPMGGRQYDKACPLTTGKPSAQISGAFRSQQCARAATLRN